MQNGGYSGGVALLLTTALIYASTFVIVKEAAAAVDPLVFVALRFTVAAAALLPFATLRGQPASAWWASIAAGALFGAGFVFQTGALAHIDAGRTGFITGLYVVATPLLGLLLFRYPLSRRAQLSIAVAVGGLFLLSYAPGSSALGDGLALAAALMFAAHVLMIERFASAYSWRFTAFVQCATAAGGALALSFLTGALQMPNSTEAWGAVLFVGVVATAITLPVQVLAQRRVPSGLTALLFALEAPFAALFGVVLRGETLSTIAGLGCALMFAATLIMVQRASAGTSPLASVSET